MTEERLLTVRAEFDDSYEPDPVFQSIFDDISQSFESGSTGHYSCPWNGHARRPQNAFSGRFFNGINAINLWISHNKLGLQSHLWANEPSWKSKGYEIKKGPDGQKLPGTKVVVPVNDPKDPGIRWDRSTVGIQKVTGELGGDAQGGKFKRILRYENEDWWNIDQVNGPPIQPFVRRYDWPPQLIVKEIFIRWKMKDGPALSKGGMSAHWNPGYDRINMPLEETFSDRDGVPAHHHYAAVLAHEMIHATGSRGRLNRPSSKGFGKGFIYAREELVAELGAAFIGSLIDVPTELRQSHMGYLSSWLKMIREDQGRAFIWALRRADQAVDYLLEQTDFEDLKDPHRRKPPRMPTPVPERAGQ